jgi:hypothetical protein
MFENVQFFSHLHLKYAESGNMTQKFLFLKISIWVSKTQNFMLISISLMPTQTNAPKKARAKYFLFCAFLRGFLLLTFVRGISESRHQGI